VGAEKLGQEGDKGETTEVEESEERIFPAEVQAGDGSIEVTIKGAQEQCIGDQVPLGGGIGQVGSKA